MVLWIGLVEHIQVGNNVPRADIRCTELANSTIRRRCQTDDGIVSGVVGFREPQSKFKERHFESPSLPSVVFQ